MLNKDQYNQDDYNDYYAQETKGAEIKYGGEEGGGGKKIILILLLLLLIGGLGYFVWKTMNDSNASNPSPNIPEASIETPTVKEETPIKVEKVSVTESSTQEESTPEEKATKNLVVKALTSTEIGSKTQMSPEDMERIVQMVTMQMKQQAAKQESQSPKVISEIETKDSLEASLEKAEVDSLSSSTVSTEKITSGDSKQQATESDKPNTYNKVIVSTTSSANDDLSKLSDEISNVINAEESTTDTSGYTQSLKSEVATRVKEMRYVTVKQGDTLGKIAKRIYGNIMDYKKIYAANPDILRRADKIYIGQRLRVPE